MTMNGKTLLNSYNIFLNSKNRTTDFSNLITSGTPNFLAYCAWQLKSIIKKTAPASYFTISVKSLILPFSFVNIGPLNKNFVLVQFPVAANIIVEEGNPNITQLLTDIKAKILLAIPTILTADLTFTYSSATQTVSILNNTTINLEFNFGGTFIGKMLGFTTNVIALANGGVVTSNININVNPLECVFVRSDNLSFSSSYESIVDKSNISDIISMIPIVASSGNYIVYNDSSAFESRLNDDRIDNISLYLTSAIDDDHVLNLVLDWTIHLQINEYKIENSSMERINLNPITEQAIPQQDPLKQEKDFLRKREQDLERQLEELEIKRKLKQKQ